MTVANSLEQALHEHFGHEAFRPQQREAITHLSAGGDALILMPTGGGKSLCYQLPAVLSDGLTLVVSPLIALMYDQVTQLQRAGVNAAYLNSSLNPREMYETEQLVANGHVQLLYVAPERVNTDRFRDLLRHRPPSLIAIDEAHCISEWGHEFRPDYLELHTLTEQFVDVPVAALTATATPQVQRQIIERLDRPQMQRFATGFLRENLTYRIVPKKESAQRLIAMLRQRPGQAAIVYCGSRKSTESTAQKLSDAGIRAGYYHAGMTPNQRSDVQSRFLDGDLTVICATIAFGMGIDKPDIRMVVHLDMPPSIEGYYQETGRAGRDGQLAECVLFYTRGIYSQQQYFIRQITDPQERERRVARLRLMMDFCEQRTCRWNSILRYFGEEPASAECGHCDNCLGAGEALPKVVEPEARRAPPPPVPDDGATPLTTQQAELYERLRQERTRVAEAEAISPYRVCSNKALDGLVRNLPSSPEAMRGVHGFGARKVAAYADVFLPIIKEYLNMHGRPRAALRSPRAALRVDSEPSDAEPIPPPDAPLESDDDAPDWVARFNRLAEWRTAVAADLQLDPSAVIDFTAMRGLAQEPPADLNSVGKTIQLEPDQLARYRDELAAILGISEQSTQPQVTTQPDRPLLESGAPDKQASWQITLDLFRSGHTLLAIAERRMQSPVTIASHFVTALKHDPSLDLRPLLPPSEYVRRVGRLLDEQPDITNTELHDRLDSTLSHAELRLTIAHLRPPD